MSDAETTDVIQRIQALIRELLWMEQVLSTESELELWHRRRDEAAAHLARVTSQ